MVRLYMGPFVLHKYHIFLPYGICATVTSFHYYHGNEAIRQKYLFQNTRIGYTKHDRGINANGNFRAVWVAVELKKVIQLHSSGPPYKASILRGSIVLFGSVQMLLTILSSILPPVIRMHIIPTEYKIVSNEPIIQIISPSCCSPGCRCFGKICNYSGIHFKTNRKTRPEEEPVAFHSLSFRRRIA